MASNISICDICDLRHLSNPSTHWCQDCDEALCSDCKEHHTLLKATRRHTTIPIDDYQRLPAFITDIKQYCDIHNEKYQNYCQKHECPICYKCIQDHAKCSENILPLETVIKHSKTSQIFQDLNQCVSDLQSNIMHMRTTREDNLSKIADQCKSAVKKIREFRIKLNHHLDAVEKCLIINLQDTESECSQQIKEVIKSLNEVESEISNLDTILKGIKQHASELQVYLATREIGRQISDKENRLTSMMENNNLNDFTVSLEINTKITNFLSDVKVFGTVSVETVPTNYNLINRKSRQAQIIATVVKSFDEIKFKQVNKFESDSKQITGCAVLPDGRLVLTEYEGRQLFIIKEDGNLDFKIPMKGNKSFAVTVVDAMNVAVSSGRPDANEKACIQIIDIKSRLVTKTIYTESWCYGVVFVDDKLVFCGYQPKGIYEIDLKTNTKSVISSTIPLHTWSNITYFDKNRFYVTSAFTCTVTSFDNKGNVFWAYKHDPHLKTPRGISVDPHGNVYVASCGCNNVTIISHDGKHSKPILDAKDGLVEPLTVQYDHDTNRLLVANTNGMAYLFAMQ